MGLSELIFGCYYHFTLKITLCTYTWIHDLPMSSFIFLVLFTLMEFLWYARLIPQVWHGLSYEFLSNVFPMILLLIVLFSCFLAWCNPQLSHFLDANSVLFTITPLESFTFHYLETYFDQSK
ncbi:hypothetical protein BDV27DRAFT_47952 [Aspergillus caelatus]|uniref:Transmembrane protein n=1 Tax=Aspergillus caelatus TaxID=61420 RepID=A0A5N7AG28_9EURO|nr:uncharacterized protein BDV27DRAFT_47952 [Aspergillus caelatus]KAE8368268.1 hypothetical protein BDV27DRAFT_47952 [Aspergillus caelatus]